MDEETGLYYYGMRYYAAWLCRFINVDPLGGNGYSIRKVEPLISKKISIQKRLPTKKAEPYTNKTQSLPQIQVDPQSGLGVSYNQRQINIQQATYISKSMCPIIIVPSEIPINQNNNIEPAKQFIFYKE